MRSERGGPIADTRLCVVGLAVLAFCFSSLDGAAALGAMVVVTAVIAWTVGLGPAELAARLRLPGMTIAALVVLLPFVSGQTVLAGFGPFTVRAEGLAAAGGIALRFVCIFTLIVALAGAVPAPKLIAALRGLGVPAVLVDMGLLTLRYIADLRDDFGRMRVAMRLRGAPAGFWSGQFRAVGWALASLLVRSHARSERVYHAMILRGHGAAGAVSPTPFATRRADWVALAAMVLAGLGLVGLDRL